MTSFGDLNFLWHLESNLQILLVFFLAHEFVWPAVAIISVFLLLLDIQTLLLMCNLDSSLTDLMNETLGLRLQNRLPRFLGIIFFGRSQSCKQISSPINGKKNWVGTSPNFSGNGYYQQVVRITKSQIFFFVNYNFTRKQSHYLQDDLYPFFLDF